MTIFELVQSKAIASYWNEITAGNPPFLGETLFPNRKKLGLDLSWIKGTKGLPVTLKLSSFDAKTMMRDRIGFSEVKTKMPFFKEGVYIDEELRQELNKVLESNNPAYIDAILGQVFEDEVGLLRSAAVSRERMRMQILTTGTVTMANNGQEYSYDYGMANNHKITLTSTAKWDNFANSDPINDLKTWADTIEDETGVRPTRALMNRTTFNYIVKNEKLAKNLYVISNGVGVITDAMVQRAVAELAGVTIAIYTKKYKNEAGNATSYIADNVVSLFPEGELGNTFFGTTPEESDLMTSSVANVSIVDTGVAITTTKETDPVNVFTKVSQITLPSCPEIDKIIVATVA